MNNLIKKNNRLGYVDLLETIAIIFVIFYHSTTYKYMILKEANWLFYTRYFLRSILSTCVPLFFFVNGYLLLNKKFNLTKHLEKSLKIIFLTLIWGIITTFFIMKIEKFPLSTIEFFNYVFTMHLGWSNHLWYMGTLICIYVFFPLIKHIYDSNYKIFIYFFVVVTFFSFGNTLINYIRIIFPNALKLLDQVNFFYWFNLFNPFRVIRGYAFAYFCLGGIAYKYKNKVLSIAKTKRNLIAVVLIIINCFLLFLLGVCCSKNIFKIWDIIWNGYDTIPTLINVLSIYILSLNYQGKNNILKCISLNTLGIYFIHVILIYKMRPIVMQYAFFSTFIGSSIFGIAILIISLLITLFLQKIPLIKKIVQI